LYGSYGLGFFPEKYHFFFAKALDNNIKPTSTKIEAIKSFKPRATTIPNQPKEGTKNNLLGRR